MDKKPLQNLKEIIQNIDNTDTNTIIELLDGLNELENIDDYSESICSLLTHEDKGVRNTASMVLLSKTPENAPSYIVKFISSNDISVRNLAGEILIKFGNISVNALIEYNNDKNDDDQKFIIDVLGLIGDSRASDHILSILSASENDNVILACIEALGNIKCTEADDILFLLYERNELYKPSVVEALGKVGSKKALEFLLNKFPEEDELIKYSILESLGYIGDVDTYFFLLEQVISTHGPLVGPLITSIFLLKEKYNLDIPFDDKMKSLLMYTLQEGTPEHKKIALSLINVFSDKDILIACLKFLGEDYELDEIIRSKIYNNVNYIYDEITKVLSANPSNIRHILNLFLSVIVDYSNSGETLNIPLVQIRNIVHSISEYLNNPDEEVRRASMEILFILDAESALLFVDSMCNDENIWNRLRLVEILETLNLPDVNIALLKLAGDPDEMVRERANEIINQRNINENNPITN